MVQAVNFAPSIERRDAADESPLFEGSWNGREITFPFDKLLPELQEYVHTQCPDDSTRMSLSLTCRKLYYSPVRPRMAGPTFAKDALLNGYDKLVRFAIEELGIHFEDRIFDPVLVEAAKRNYRHIFEIKEIKEIFDRDFDTDLFDQAVEDAIANNCEGDFSWITSRMIESPERIKEIQRRGYLRAGNLEGLQSLGPIRVNSSNKESGAAVTGVVEEMPPLAERQESKLADYLPYEALKHANLRMVKLLVDQKSLTSKLDWMSLARNKDLEVFNFLYEKFGADANESIFHCCLEEAITYDNIELCERLVQLITPFF